MAISMNNRSVGTIDTYEICKFGLRRLRAGDPPGENPLQTRMMLLRDIVIVGAWTGLRQNNIIHVTRTQVNLSSKILLIESAEMKNNDNLGIPIAGPAYEVLKRAMKVPRLGTPYIFCTEDNLTHHKQKVHRHFKEALKKAEIVDFRFHDLRHCYGT